MMKVRFNEDGEIPEYFSLYFGKVNDNQLTIDDYIEKGDK